MARKTLRQYIFADGGTLDGTGPGDPTPTYSPAEQKIVDQYTKLGYTVTKGANGQLQYKKNPGAGPAVQQPQQPAAQQPMVTQPVVKPPVSTTPTTPVQGAIPLPTADKASRKQYMDTFKKKYGLEHFGDIPLRVNETPVFGSRTSKQAAIEEANKLGLNPALFYSSSMVEGQSGLYRGAAGQNAQGQDLFRGYTGDKDYPVSGLWAFGLDSFQDYYPSLVKKGYLPKDFDKQWKNYDQDGAPIGSTSPSGQESTMFKSTDAAIQAKAAMMKAFYDESDNYAKKKGYNLTPEQRDYFALAHFNSGAHGYEMMDAYNKAGLLKNNDFLNSGTIPNVNVPFMYQGKQMSAGASAKLHQQIYGNISPRIAAARGLQQEGLFEYGGKVPKKPKGVPKYANGTEDPIFGGQPKDTGLKNAPNFNPFGSFPSSPAPINPDAPTNQQMYRLDPTQTDVGDMSNTVEIDPLSDGSYVNAQGQMQATQAQQAIADATSARNYTNALRTQKTRNNAEVISNLGITAINAFFNRKNQNQIDRANRRNTIMQNINSQSINPYLEGTGSEAIMKNGGSIHIKPENKGKFTAAANRAGKSVQGYAAQILAHPDNYSPTLRKRANFARNAAKWHADGGEIDPQDNTGIQVLDGGNTKQVSTSDHSNPMVEFTGRTHDNGGIGINYGSNIAEVEDKEIGWVDDDGSLNIFGKLKLPGTSMTFRTAAKNLAEQESKVDKEKHKYLNILNNSNANDPYQESARSTAKVMTKSLDRQSQELAEKKEAMASYQSLVLSMAHRGQDKMEYGGTMPKRPKYQNGAVLSGDPIKDIAKAIAEFESGSSYNAIGKPVTKGQYKGQRALGKYQIMEDNMRAWGKAATGKDLTVADFINSPAIQDQVAEYQMRQIAKSNPNPQDIASIWFTGRPTSNASAASATDDNGTSGNQYVNAVMKIYNGINGGTYNPTQNAPASTKVTTPTPNIMNYTPKREYNPTAGGDVIDTKYGSARRQASNFKDEVKPDNTQQQRDYISPLAIEQIAPELLSIATNRRDPVSQLSYQPDLKQTFDISYQLGRNENQSTFNQTAKIAEQTGNTGVLSDLAAQKYKADQTYNMQEIQGNAQNRLQTYAQNVDVLNDAQVKNLALIADQQAKEAQAKFNTRAQDLAAIGSIAAKVQQNRLENRTYNAYANLFKHYGFDKKGNVTFNPDNITQRFTAGEAQQFGMMAAQQGASAIMNGDFSRQFTKVKNNDGSTTTTETLGNNKKIQEEYKTLKNQGFDDNIIGNMLRAKYPETID